MTEESKITIVSRSQPEPLDMEEAEELELISNYQACFAGPSGDFVVKDLLKLVGFGGSTFRQSEFKSLEAAHLDGCKSIVWRILNYSGRINPL